MQTNYDKEVAASVIDKALQDYALMCGGSVVYRALELYLARTDKCIVSFINNVTYE